MYPGAAIRKHRHFNMENETMRIAVYPGSFDPCTNGHLDIITRGGKMFDKLIVAVLTNSGKAGAFTPEERVTMLKAVTDDLPNVEITCFSGLLADFCVKAEANIIIKGLRAVSDFEYEFQMALTNKSLNADLETLFLPTSKDCLFLSSSIARDIARYGGELRGIVPEEIIPFVLERAVSASNHN